MMMIAMIHGFFSAEYDNETQKKCYFFEEFSGDSLIKIYEYVYSNHSRVEDSKVFPRGKKRSRTESKPQRLSNCTEIQLQLNIHIV